VHKGGGDELGSREATLQEVAFGFKSNSRPALLRQAPGKVWRTSMSHWQGRVVDEPSTCVAFVNVHRKSAPCRARIVGLAPEAVPFTTPCPTRSIDRSE